MLPITEKGLATYSQISFKNGLVAPFVQLKKGPKSLAQVAIY
jgi:hypothetical protein